MTDQIKSIHAVWEKLTGQVVNIRATERIWYEFLAMEFTEADLACVLAQLTYFNRTSSGAKFRINLQKICGDLENFASLLGEARAKQRNKIKAPTSRDVVLNQLRPQIGDPTATGTTKTIADVMKSLT
jgi:hypothetical protein